MKTNQYDSLFYFTKRHICILSLIILMTGCLGPRKINKWVDKHYGGTVPAASKKKSDFITISSNLPFMGEKLSATEKKTSNVLPLIVYWQWDYRNTCTLNPQIPVNNFTTTALTYGSKKLKQKLGDQRLELTIEKIPNMFVIDDKGHLIWIVYAYGWDKLSIQPDSKEMTVSYKIFQADNTVIKNGVVTVPNLDKGVTLGMFKSLKKRTWQYLDDYNANITSMSKNVVDKLMAEL